MDGTEMRVPKRILNTLLSSLAAGVVPRSGAPYIAIGRKEEIASLLANLDEVDEGGAAVRFLIGRYGSGKSFLIQLIRGYATDRGFLCADADLSPERRLSGGSDAGLATYRELMKNLSSKASPDGGALPIILSRYYTTLQTELLKDDLTPEEPGFVSAVVSSVSRMLDELEGIVLYSGNKINIDYFVYDIMDPEDVADICDFMAEQEKDDIEAAIREFGQDFSENEIRLVRIKFISDMAN